VLIIGSGLAGLTAGFELAERGFSVEILEAARFPGGRTTSWVDDRGRTTDTGAHVVADHYVNLLDILERVGGSRRLVWFRDQLYLRKGHAPTRWRLNDAPPPFHMLGVALKFRGSLWQRFKLGLAALDGGSYPDDLLHRLDKMSYADWQRQYLGETLLEVGEAAAEAACFLPAREASAQVVLSWIRAMARNASASDLASWDGPFQDALIAPLVQAIERRGGRLRLGTAVVRLEHDGRRVTRVGTRPSDCAGPFHSPDGAPPLKPQGAEERLEHDFVISAMPVQAFKALATPELLAAAGLTSVSSLSTVPAIGLTVWFDRPLSASPDCAPLCNGVSMRGFMNFASVRRAGPDEPAAVQFVLTDARTRTLQPDEQIMSDVISDFREVWPAAREMRPVDYALERVGSAMHASVPGAYTARPASTTRLQNFFLAGDWTKHEVKPSMEGATVSGRCAADALLRSLGRPGVNILRPAEGYFTQALRGVRRALLSARSAS
jgi:uncharacterized protein with NAD-binding domain and iron-sulfur cluster